MIRISEIVSSIKMNLIRKRRSVIHNNKNGVRIGAFISIPKNASKSILNFLELGPNRDQETTTSLIIYENHQRAEVLARKYDLNNLFVFCFSRNPYDRCVSWYQFHKAIEPYNKLTFESWIKEGMPHHWNIQNQTNYQLTGLSPLLQFNFVENYKVDFIGSLENFSEDLNKIIKKLNSICIAKNIKYRFKFVNKKMNTSKRYSDFELYYTEETKEIVYSLL